MGPPPRIPVTIVTACVLWLFYGTLGLLGGLVSMSASPNKTAAIPQLVFALAFLITGVQVLLGKASQLIGSGVVCIVLGGLGLLVSVMLSFGPGWITGLALANSLLLIVAGILALVGNGAYVRWRAFKMTMRR